MNQEKKIVRMTLFILALTLFLVYIVFLGKQDNQGQIVTTNPNIDPTVDLVVERPVDGLNSGTIANSGTVLINSLEESISDSTVIENNEFSGTENRDNSVNSTVGDINLPNIGEEDVIFDTENGSGDGGFVQQGNDPIGGTLSQQQIIELDGTELSLDRPEAIQSLSVDYQYILRDDIAYYIYLGTGYIDFGSIARKLGGNIVELQTETAILSNGLFGDKVTFVNIPGITYQTSPVYQRKIVFMVIYFDQDSWLLQVGHDNYHENKELFSQKFDQVYP